MKRLSALHAFNQKILTAKLNLRNGSKAASTRSNVILKHLI